MSTIESKPKASERTSYKRQKEFSEDRLLTTYARAWAFFDEHKTLIYGALAGLVVLVLLLGGYLYYRSVQQDEAQQYLAAAVIPYNAGEYRAALDGVGEQPGLLTIAGEYGSTQAGNLAHFYAGDALYQLGEYDQALEHFQAYDKGEDLFGAAALAAEGAIYETQGNYAEAAAQYEEAAGLFENDVTAPQYLLSAGRNYEAAGNFEAALGSYRAVKEDHPDSGAAQTVDRYIARAEARASTD